MHKNVLSLLRTLTSQQYVKWTQCWHLSHWPHLMMTSVCMSFSCGGDDLEHTQHRSDRSSSSSPSVSDAASVPCWLTRLICSPDVVAFGDLHVV
ncbi:hypothetical protein DPMN_088096 [Dreissena polymorpha]|uniref:Uncharacterized protein n=1 Tax=Dreissena polymorpha TaxID=45954 RepID=A0A9D4QX02_DREPO|nr:hypothetical protein DPMN_088096 [Dreissena polymorpha]